ncbi:MAG: hypothetical protein M3430_20700 [Acidobacteriota bacterium]|nr:hypothetical protein [Acidobacteriota bacterium]
MYAQKQRSGAFAAQRVAPDAALQQSRAARFGQGCVNAAALLRTSKSVVTLAAAVLFVGAAFVDPALAQQGGANLGGNSSNPINAFKTALDIGVWVLLGLGIFGIGWGIYNIMFGNSWGKQMVGGAGALGFAGIVALVNDIINDTPPTLPSY